jgi:hypothetical protein
MVQTHQHSHEHSKRADIQTLMGECHTKEMRETSQHIRVPVGMENSNSYLALHAMPLDMPNIHVTTTVPKLALQPAANFQPVSFNDVITVV